jgi:extracellular matrix regulatory protein A
MIRWDERMMISIGHKNFLESSCIDEILTPHAPRAARLKRLAAEVGMLISATEGKRAKSMIKLKTRHLVLSALEPETLRSKVRRARSSSAYADDYEATERIGENVEENNLRAGAENRSTWRPKSVKVSSAYCDEAERRSGIERRRFLYTCHIPERRSGADRRRSERLSRRTIGLEE